MKWMIFAGAGTSIELGVPGMLGMANEFLDHSKQWGINPDLVEKFIGAPPDIEFLIENLDRICSATDSLQTMGMDTAAHATVDKIRAEVEWFVQHAAERIVAKNAQLMWGTLLRNAASADVTFVTTNYDRAIELAANAENIDLDDGFGNFNDRETASWTGFSRSGGLAKLVKIHGSTDWFSDATTGEPIKLRHPMPLFGRTSLHLPDGQQFGSALVLPSREKLLTRAPYPVLSQNFLNASDACDIAVFVGSSLRDRHTRDAAKSIAARVSVFIVNPEGDNCGIPNATGISQCASRFLISTLPAAMKASDPAKELTKQSGSDKTGMLIPFRNAMDVAALPSVRCAALDELTDREATFDHALLSKLIQDKNPTIARYALGLVLLSPDREPLTAEAEALHAEDKTFQDDFKMMKRIGTARA